MTSDAPSHDLRRRLLLIIGGLLLLFGLLGELGALTSKHAKASTSAIVTGIVVLAIGAVLLVFGMRTPLSDARRDAEQRRATQRSTKRRDEVLQNTARGRLREMFRWCLTTPSGLVGLAITVAVAVLLPSEFKVAPVILYAGATSQAVRTRINAAQASTSPDPSSSTGAPSEQPEDAATN